MNENSMREFERRSRDAYEASVEAVDMRIRSRLTQARHAALAAASSRRRPFAHLRPALWAPALGAAAALVVGVALWSGRPAPEVSGLEDLELVASNDQMELLQDDPEFYDWLDKAPAGDAAGTG